MAMLTCGTLMALTSMLPAQEFRAPNFPSPPPAQIQQPSRDYSEGPSYDDQRNLLLEQKLEHARQLRAQMERAGREQGASPEFAEKAYQAQQAYLAEQAFREHRAYQEKLRQDQRSSEPATAPSATSANQYNVAQTGFKAQPDYRAPQASNIPNLSLIHI